MIDHDKNVGSLLDYLDELGIAADTLVVYSTDNGPHRNTWPDSGMTPFRSETDPTGKARSGFADQASPRQDRARHHLERDRPVHESLPTFLEIAGNKTWSNTKERDEGDRPRLQEPHRRVQPA